jgi:phytoene dehydrogenase-like protein
VHEDGRCVGVRLEDGEELRASCVLSSAGWAETMRMTGNALYDQHVEQGELGTLSFVESIHVLDELPAKLGFDATIVFFNEEQEFAYRRPRGLVDPRSGVICCPNNYASETPLPEGIVRTTTLADPAAWRALEGEQYEAAKASCTEQTLAVVNGHLGFDPREREVYRDSFTPRTVERFTGKLDGAVYGCSKKRLDGRTPLEDLHLIGTDQGLLGVTGSMLSGISIANRYALQASAN